MTFGVFNLWCGGIVVLLLLPNIWYGLKRKGPDFQPESRGVNALEQIGRYGSMIFSIVPLGVRGGAFGFAAAAEMLLWLALTAGLLLAYYICWFLYGRKASPGLALALAVLPGTLFLVHGLLLRHLVLCVCAGIFAVSHVYIVRQNTKQR